jgi:hypothetical protein
LLRIKVKIDCSFEVILKGIAPLSKQKRVVAVCAFWQDDGEYSLEDRMKMPIFNYNI